MSTEKTGQLIKFQEVSGGEVSTKGMTMGVASLGTKRRLGGAPERDVLATKLAKIAKNHNNNDFISLPTTNSTEDSIAVTTDFLTTSILARTLLTTSSSMAASELDPLESLKSSLEALPAPNGESLLGPFLKTTISSDDEFGSLLPSSLTPIAIVNSSPGADWNNGHQVITEDENGKSYFNLGSAETIVARKGSNNVWIGGGGCGGGNNCNGDDDNASSSSCESLSSSDDLFNSGEEFDDGSEDDEEEFSSYKQQRSTVLHLSLCKLNKFRSQHCVEPSLHRSVLICNTLRHIEQEIKSEDEVDESLKSRERLPSFWRPTSNHHPHCFGGPPPSAPSPTSSSSSAPGSGGSSSLLMEPRPDPYLSPHPYNMSPGVGGRGDVQLQGGSPPYLYDYSCLRPTPYHTTSYDYEQDLPSLDTSSANPNGSTLLECDSGYGEELSYYYSTATSTTPNANCSNSSSTPPTPNILVDPSGASSSTPTTAPSPSQFLQFSSQPQQQQSSSNEPETESDSSSGCSPPPKEVHSPHFVQQDSQCGMESRRSCGHLNFSSHSMPMDNLISSSYSSSL